MTLVLFHGIVCRSLIGLLFETGTTAAQMRHFFRICETDPRVVVGAKLQRCTSEKHTAAGLQKSLAAEIDTTEARLQNAELTAVRTPQKVLTRLPSSNAPFDVLLNRELG